MGKVKTVKLDNDGTPVTVTVERASAKRGIMRYRLMLADEVTDEDLRYITMFVYPNLAAGTTSVDGLYWPLTAEQVAELPEQLVTGWLEAVYEVNPNWEPRRPDDSEKKE